MDEPIFLRQLSSAQATLRRESFRLVLDSYSTQITPLARDKTEGPGINLRFVPAEKQGCCSL
jgi:hypothetical protein